jgi:tryptophan synthase alpha subunit
MTGVERIQAVFERAKQDGRAAFMPYHAMGYPDRQTAIEVIRWPMGQRSRKRPTRR